eukprot:gene19644-26330_t
MVFIDVTSFQAELANLQGSDQNVVVNWNGEFDFQFDAKVVQLWEPTPAFFDEDGDIMPDHKDKPLFVPGLEDYPVNILHKITTTEDDFVEIQHDALFNAVQMIDFIGCKMLAKLFHTNAAILVDDGNADEMLTLSVVDSKLWNDAAWDVVLRRDKEGIYRALRACAMESLGSFISKLQIMPNLPSMLALVWERVGSFRRKTRTNGQMKMVFEYTGEHLPRMCAPLFAKIKTPMDIVMMTNCVKDFGKTRPDVGHALQSGINARVAELYLHEHSTIVEYRMEFANDIKFADAKFVLCTMEVDTDMVWVLKSITPMPRQVTIQMVCLAKDATHNDFPMPIIVMNNDNKESFITVSNVEHACIIEQCMTPGDFVRVKILYVVS